MELYDSRRTYHHQRGEVPRESNSPEEVRIMPAENAETGENLLLFCGIGEKLNPQHPERRHTMGTDMSRIRHSSRSAHSWTLQIWRISNHKPFCTPVRNRYCVTLPVLHVFGLSVLTGQLPRFTLALPVRHLFTGQVLGVRSWFMLSVLDRFTRSRRTFLTALSPLHTMPLAAPKTPTEPQAEQGYNLACNAHRWHTASHSTPTGALYSTDRLASPP